MTSGNCKLSGAAVAFACFLMSGSGNAAPYAPLDCAEASAVSEMAVCKSYALGQDEARQATLFSILTSLVAMGQRGDLIGSQRRWIETREACGRDTKCLATAYKNRIDVLQKALDALAQRGPL